MGPESMLLGYSSAEVAGPVLYLGRWLAGVFCCFSFCFIYFIEEATVNAYIQLITLLRSQFCIFTRELKAGSGMFED